MPSVPPVSARAASPHLRSFVLGLAFLFGWADVATSQRFGCYASKMTGNFLKMSSAISAGRLQDATFILAVLLSYVVGAGVFRAIDINRARGAAATSMATTTVIAPAVLLACAAIDLLPSASKWPVWLLALASGAVNAASSEKGDTVTCMITGHLLTLGQALGSSLAAVLIPAQRAGAIKSMQVLSSFLCSSLAASTGWLPTPNAQWLPPFASLGVGYATVLFLHGRGSGVTPPPRARP